MTRTINQNTINITMSSSKSKKDINIIINGNTINIMMSSGKYENARHD